MADNQNTDIKEYAENGLSQVTDALNRRNYNLSVATARQVAERLVRSYASEKKIDYTTLADSIEQLYASGAINMTSRDAFHALRVYGNKAAHDGDCDEDDARNAYHYLKNEVQTWQSRNRVSVDRTPVRVDRNSLYTSSLGNGNRENTLGEDSGRRSASQNSDTFVQSTPVRRRRTDATLVRSGNRSARRGDMERRRHIRGAKADPAEESGVDIYSILRIVIPVIILILIIIILISLFGGNGSDSDILPTTKSSVQESETTPIETTHEETTPIETTPAVVLYQISGDNVNIRYAENTNRVYTQLSKGYEIGEVSDMEGTNYAQFTLDGIAVVVSKDYIEPVGGTDTTAEETATEDLQ